MPDYELPPVLKFYDPKVNTSAKKFYSIVEGAKNSVVTKIQATNESQSSWTFQYRTSSRHSGVNPRIPLKCHVKIDLTAPGNTGAGAPDLVGQGLDAMRCYPLSSIIDFIKLQPGGGGNIDVPLSNVIGPLSRVANNDVTSCFLNEPMPVVLDRTQDYATLAGTALSPLADYGSNVTLFGLPGRGAWNYSISIPAGGSSTTAVSIEFDCYEFIKVPPLNHGFQDNQPIVGLDALTFTVSLSSNKERIWSGTKKNITGGALTTAVTLSSPEIWVESFELPEKMQKYIQSHPIYDMRYSLIEYSPYNTRQTITAQGQEYKFSSDMFKTQGVPKYMVMALRKPVSACRYYEPDTYSTIKGINIKINEKPGILSTATHLDLHRMSVSNGLKDSLNEFMGITSAAVTTADNKEYLTGSVLCLQFGRDIPIDGLVSGMNESLQLQLAVEAVSYKPIASVADNYTPELALIFIYEGVLSIDTLTGIANPLVGVVSAAEARDAPVVEDMSYYDLHNVVGGNLFNKLKDSVSGALNKYIRPALQVANKADEVAKKVGLGRAGGKTGGGLEVVGGKMKSKKSLDDRF